jgi:hypothetical protein
LTFEPEAFSSRVKYQKIFCQIHHLEKYVKEITTLVWGFIWGGGINEIDRKVCCLEVENGGMGMINIQEFIDSKRIKLLYRIVHEPLESWNAIGRGSK